MMAGSGRRGYDGSGGAVRPEAVLLDAGGIFVLPERARIADVFRRNGLPVPADDLIDEAHYRAAARFAVDRDVEGDWVGSWQAYLRDYVDVCAAGLPGVLDVEELHRHLDSEFADAALWTSVVPGARDGLARLARAGVRLGVVSNADGLMAQRLRHLEQLQVGPGLGVPVECVIDSGEVGVMKPDPRIFHIALTAMGIGPERAWYVGDLPAFDVAGARRAGLRPWAMDPLGLQHDADYDRVDSLDHLARIVEAL
jgi:FMN phosphatase YigB (HAD superfamily)